MGSAVLPPNPILLSSSAIRRFSLVMPNSSYLLFSLVCPVTLVEVRENWHGQSRISKKKEKNYALLFTVLTPPLPPPPQDSCCVAEPHVPCFKWRLLISYDGTRYAGWQYQQSPPTIQCLIEKALTQATKVERKDLRLVGASRTDTGVHAWGQVAHFVTPFCFDSLETVHAALNGLLPADIRVREISPAVPDFHARFSTISKVYHYKIYNGTILDPFQRFYTYQCLYKLNSAVMREAASYFIGKHDFSAFANAAQNDRVGNPVKIIFRFDVIEMGALIQLEVEGSGFLYRQVRNMVGLLIQVGKEAISPDVVPQILASRDRKELAKYAPFVPPQGLCLVSIKYNEDHLKLPSGSPETSFGRYHTVSKCKLPFY